MLISERWQSRIALLTALGMTSTAVLPIMLAAPAIAGSQSYITGQLFPQTPRQTPRQSSELVVPAGTTIPVRYEKSERIIVTPEETAPVTLTVAATVRTRQGTILIPEGSQIEGKLQSASGGTQFVAEEIILGNSKQRYPIDATSSVITQTETINKGSDPDILRGAAIGAGAAAILSEIFGNISFGEVLAGAGVGAVAELLLRRGSKEVEVVVVEPDTDLDLRLQEDFVRGTAQ